jgi:predicted  nucleic acid-binding Zn-ribbon protein
MVAVAFDTLRFMRTMETSGMPPRQAEALAEAVRDSTESADLVTRKDLQIELQPIKAELGALRQDMAQLEQRMDAKLDAKIGTLRLEMKADIGALRADIAKSQAEILKSQGEILKSQTEIIKWCVGAIFAAAGVALAIARLMH